MTCQNTYVLDTIRTIRTSTDGSTGSGAFSTVWIKDEDTVIKTSRHANSDAWLWWALYCMQRRDDPSLPNIKSVTVDWANDSFVAEMEYLDFFEGICYDIEEVFERNYMSILVGMAGRALGNDVSSGNLMYRGDTVVINDPIAYKGWSAMMQAKDDDNIRRLWRYLQEYPTQGFNIINKPKQGE